MDHPKSMLRRKLIRNFIEEDFGDFEYKRLPNSFRHIKKDKLYFKENELYK